LEEAARHVLQLSRAKLAASPLYLGEPEIGAYICNEHWRERLFFNKDYGVAGVAYPFSMKIFLRESAVQENRIVSRRGIHVPGYRTLDFFVTHEMTHALTSRAVGPIRMLGLPQWIREGYADYVAWGPGFNYADARRAFLDGAPGMDYRQTGLYWRFAFLVAHMLDHKHWTVERLLTKPFPEQAEIESEIRSNDPANAEEKR